uniref:Uncharacterized protein n=1 Tax=Sander lucioperca TaxID=283035 RepID=A0A8C9ZIT5_SANLU
MFSPTTETFGNIWTDQPGLTPVLLLLELKLLCGQRSFLSQN